jgi:hypothetical protein
MCDPHCLSLAEGFIDDVKVQPSPEARKRLASELAQRIQDAIEEFLSEKGLES